MNLTKLPILVKEALEKALGPGPIPLHEPIFDGNEWKYVKDCIDSTFVSSVGSYVSKFESDLQKYTGSKHAIAIVNGTSALHCALYVAGVKSGDEVLVPSLSFVASANAIRYCNAVPHFVDSDKSNLGIDVEKLEAYLSTIVINTTNGSRNRNTGNIIRAILPMHTFGHIGDMDGILRLAKKYRLDVIEDAAEAIGSFYKKNHAGTIGKLGILSFNGNKTITTGGGGAILTNDDFLANKLRHITTTAKLKHAWEFIHDEVGFNYRMPNLNAALGCAQLEGLQKKLTFKRDLFSRYHEVFKGISQLKVITESNECDSNYWLQAIMLEENSYDFREEILKVANGAGFGARPAWNLISSFEPYKKCPSMDLTNANLLGRSLINIPSMPKIISINHEA